MNITPDMWPADTEALHTRITRLEAQSETRRLQTAYWQERARVVESKRDEAIRIQNGIRKERNEAEARIQAIEKMIAPIPAHPNKFAHTCGQDPDDVVHGYPDCPGCWVTALRHLLDGDG